MSVHDTQVLPGSREDLEFQPHREPCLGSAKHAVALSRRKTKIKMERNELAERGWAVLTGLTLPI